MKFIFNPFKYLKNPVKNHPSSLLQRIKDVWHVLMGGFPNKNSRYRFGITDWLILGISAYLRKVIDKLNRDPDPSLPLLVVLTFFLGVFAITNAIRYLIGAVLFVVTFPLTLTIQLALWTDNVTDNRGHKMLKKSYFFVPHPSNKPGYRVVRENLALNL